MNEQPVISYRVESDGPAWMVTRYAYDEAIRQVWPVNDGEPASLEACIFIAHRLLETAEGVDYSRRAIKCDCCYGKGCELCSGTGFLSPLEYHEFTIADEAFEEWRDACPPTKHEVDRVLRALEA